MSEIIPNVVVSMPSQLFTMARSFKACANGKIYIGKINTDPTIPDNQIEVYIEREDGSYIAAMQPIIINQAGYPVYAGQLAKFVTVEGHSMAVYDSYGAQQFYFPNVLKYAPDQFKRELAGSNGSQKVGHGDSTVYSKMQESPYDKMNKTFHDGATVSKREQIIYDENSSSWYQWTGSLPKIIPANSSPLDPLFRNVHDADFKENIRKYYSFDAATGDDRQIQADINKYKYFEMPSNTTAYLKSGSPIILPDGTLIRGAGFTSQIICEQDVEMFRTTNEAHWVTFDSLHLDKSAVDKSTTFHIVGVNSIALKVTDCFLMGMPGFKYNGIGICDGEHKPEENFPASGFMTQIINTQISQGCISINHSDSKIFGGYVWSNESVANSVFAIKATNAANLRIIGLDFAPGVESGIHLINTPNTAITGCFFDGSGSSPIYTGWGVSADNGCAGLNIVDNIFWSLSK
ncbi:hypothetical protein GU833_06285 [Photorhabdus akhurstii]